MPVFYYNSIDKLTNDTTCAAISAVLSASCCEMATATLSSSLYCLGGYVGPQTNNIDKLTNDTTCAAVSANLSYSVSKCRGITLSSSVYVIGGGTSVGAIYSINKLTSDSACGAITARLYTQSYELSVAKLNL